VTRRRGVGGERRQGEGGQREKRESRDKVWVYRWAARDKRQGEGGQRETSEGEETRCEWAADKRGRRDKVWVDSEEAETRCVCGQQGSRDKREGEYDDETWRSAK
jgi:hypothetical protein